MRVAVGAVLFVLAGCREPADIAQVVAPHTLPTAPSACAVVPDAPGKSALVPWPSTDEMRQQVRINIQAWRGYLNHVHEKLHPVLSELPEDTGPETPVVSILLEVAADTGEVMDSAIVESNATPEYTRLVSRSMLQSAPFGKAPAEIVSPDGRVYFGWEYHANHTDACTARFAFPWIRPAHP